jgi:hypothetical protein
LFITQLGFDALGHLERVIVHRFEVQCDIQGQKVFERIEAHAVRNQG